LILYEKSLTFSSKRVILSALILIFETLLIYSGRSPFQYFVCYCLILIACVKFFENFTNRLDYGMILVCNISPFFFSSENSRIENKSSRKFLDWISMIKKGQIKERRGVLLQILFQIRCLLFFQMISSFESIIALLTIALLWVCFYFM